MKKIEKQSIPKSDEFIIMESQCSDVSVLINHYQDFKMVKNVARAMIDILIK